MKEEERVHEDPTARRSKRRLIGSCDRVFARIVIMAVAAVFITSDLLQSCDAFTAPVRRSVAVKTTTLLSTSSDNDNRRQRRRIRNISSQLKIKLYRPLKKFGSSKKKRHLHYNEGKTTSIFPFPWSFWFKLRPKAFSSSRSSKEEGSLKSKRGQRRWEVELTSKPFKGVEELQSTLVNCILALAIYFIIGTCVFPWILEPSWTFIDALYFSMATLTTIGYGDVVVSGGTSLRSTIGKLFLIAYNIYAVCISVSALGIIAKMALAQQKNVLSKARERARSRFVKLFSIDDDDEDDDEEEGDDDDEDECNWVDNIYLDKCVEDENQPHEPQTMLGTLWQSLQKHSLNFVGLIVIASMLVRVEKWSLVDILYLWNCTATTIGFGDISPRTQMGRLLSVIFIPLSVISLGEVIASCVAHMNARAASKAEKDFLRRQITFKALEYLDVNDDGKVCQLDFVTFMLLAMQKVDRKTMRDLKSLFNALDADKTGFIEKEDLILLRQRKRLAKKKRREARNRKKESQTREPVTINN